MHPSFQKLIDAKAPMELKPPASPKAISQFERAQGIELPEHYWEFLQFGNGGHFFGPSGPNFYGIDRNDQYYSLEKENAAKASDFPSAWYIVGATSWGDRFCIDFATNEVIQWDHETREESDRWASIFECVDYMFSIYTDNQEDEYDEDEKAEEDNDSSVISIVTEFFHNDDGLFIKFEKGIFANQTLFMFCQLKNGVYRPNIGLAKQISPISFDAIPPYEDLKFIRNIPFGELLTLKHALEVYCEANQLKMAI